MPLRDKKVGGIRGPIPPGYILGRVDPGSGDVQLLSLNDLLGGMGLQGAITATATTIIEESGAGNWIPLSLGVDPGIVLVSDGAGNLILIAGPA